MQIKKQIRKAVTRVNGNSFRLSIQKFNPVMAQSPLAAAHYGGCSKLIVTYTNGRAS